MQILGLDISKLSATYWLITEVPNDPKQFARKYRENKLKVEPAGRDKLLSLDFDFAVLEPTGVYSRIWRHWLTQAGREYRLVGHEALANYRKSWSMSKTDKLDGLAMAMYGIERRDRPSAWIIERDYRLSDLIFYHQHLNRQKNGFQNNLRQKLVWQIPEWHSKKIIRPWRGKPPGILEAIAGNPSAKWMQEIEESCGTGLGEEAQSLARILIQIETEEAIVEGWIDEELSKPQYVPYLDACDRCGLSPWLSAILISTIYPFQQFLTPEGRPRISHSLSKANSKRVSKDESLRAFKLSCGIGLTWVQSGDFQGWVAGGSGLTRKSLRSSIVATYLMNKKAIKNGNESREDMKLIKHQYDNHGMMKVARKWIERFYKELKKEFC